MASRIELARQYIQYQRDRDVEAAAAMLADDVVVSNPMQGTVTGKDAVEQNMRARPAGGAGGANMSWSEPKEDGDTVKIVGSGSPFGPIKIEVTFNERDQISRIDVGLA